jgi:hypothetical protein
MVHMSFLLVLDTYSTPTGSNKGTVELPLGLLQERTVSIVHRHL